MAKKDTLPLTPKEAQTLAETPNTEVEVTREFVSPPLSEEQMKDMNLASTLGEVYEGRPVRSVSFRLLIEVRLGPVREPVERFCPYCGKSMNVLLGVPVVCFGCGKDQTF